MYDHYIALDWAKSNMAIAKMTKGCEKINVIDVPASISEMKLYLEQIKGKKILTVEETTTAQWLYTELKAYVDEIIICNPYRNKLLNDGPKTDKLDAKKLVQLLKSNLLKPVFHSGDFFFSLRKFISGYEDIVKTGVRFKNQKKSLLRAIGLDKETGELKRPYEAFVLEGINRWINYYEQEKRRYEKEFLKLSKKNQLIRTLKSIPGIGDIGAVKLAAIVVDPKRFKNKGSWLSYCGLIKLEKISGGRSYGKKKPRYCRAIKSIFKTAAMAVIQERTENTFKNYYNDLIKNYGYPDYKARHHIARRIAVITLGVLKTTKKFENKWEQECKLAA